MVSNLRIIWKQTVEGADSIENGPPPTEDDDGATSKFRARELVYARDRDQNPYPSIVLKLRRKKGEQTSQKTLSRWSKRSAGAAYDQDGWHKGGQFEYFVHYQVRFHIIRNACIQTVGNYQSCIVSKLRIIQGWNAKWDEWIDHTRMYKKVRYSPLWSGLVRVRVQSIGHL